MSQVKEVSDAERALKREEMAGITDTNQVLVEVSAGTSPLPHDITLFLKGDNTSSSLISHGSTKHRIGLSVLFVLCYRVSCACVVFRQSG